MKITARYTFIRSSSIYTMLVNRDIWNERLLLKDKTPASLFVVGFHEHTLILFYYNLQKSSYSDYCIFSFNRQDGVAAACPTHNREEARFDSSACRLFLFFIFFYFNLFLIL